MKIRLHFVTALLLAVVLAGCTAPSGGRWPREGVVSPASAKRPAQTVISEQLALTITTDQDRYSIGEPMYLTLQVRNSSTKPQRAIASLDPSDIAVVILITGPDGATKTFGPLVEADNGEHLNIILQPNSVIADAVPIFFGSGGWTFTQPGRYAVTALYNVPSDGQILQTASQPLEIEIDASPVGEKLIGKDDNVRVEVGKFLTWQAGDHLSLGQERMRELLDSAPDSLLANYIHAAFARSLGEPFMDYRRGEVRPIDCKQAHTHLAQVDLARMPGYIRMQSALVGGRCGLLARDWEAAASQLAQARTLRDGQPEFRSFTKRIDRLEAYLKSAQNPRQ